MAEIIRMPLLSDTMKEGVIASWHKKVGDSVKSDDVIAEVETDKATMEVMPYADGTILYLAGEKGTAIPVNSIMAIVGNAGEDINSILAAEQQAAPQQTQTQATPTAPAESHSAQDFILPKGVTIVRMPLLSDTMKEGKIVSWLKNEGDAVKSDDVLAEVETDKATMEVMGYADGTLLHIGVPAGSAAPVNGIICIVGPKGTDIAPILAAEQNPAPRASTTTTSSTPTITSSTSTPAPVTTEVAGQDDDRIKISPLARKIAKDKGIDIHALKGTGDGGRIVKRDIDNYVPTVAASPTPTGNVAQLGAESYTDVPLSQMRKVIALRLSESKFQAPHFYLKMTVKMDNAIAARSAMNAISPVKISFNDLVIKACAMALRKHPAVNSSWMGDFIRQNHHIHIGTAVAVDEGLIVPVVKFADQKSLADIAADAKQLVDKARNKKLQPQEFTGNTFTISNLGMMNIDEFTAIINPPDSCILAVGKIEPTPVVENDAVTIRHLMRITLSCDHRVVDGAVGSQFLKTLQSYLENPVNMLV